MSGSIQPHPRGSEIGEWLLVRFASQSPAASGLVRRVLEHFTLSQSRVDFASPSASAGEAAQAQTSVGAAPARKSIFPVTDLTAVPGDSRLVDSGVLQFASGFEQEALADPVVPKPYDVLRQRIGRLTHIPKWRKCPITADKVQTPAWHLLNGERMIRQYFTDRGLAKVLGKPTFYTAAGQNIISFEYLQPMENASEMINARPYLHAAAVKDFDLVYHGTYWECAPRILATGVLSESNTNLDLGEREFHGVMGTYSSPNAFETLTGYGWPVNVFGNNCYYSIGFEMMGYRALLKKNVPTYGICLHRKSV